MSCFRFIAAEKTNHPISLMCRVLGVSRSVLHRARLSLIPDRIAC